MDLIPASIMMLKFTGQILHQGVKAGGLPLILSLSLRLFGMETSPFIRSPDGAMVLKSNHFADFPGNDLE